MITFAELVEAVEHLSEDESDELWRILRKKKQTAKLLRFPPLTKKRTDLIKKALRKLPGHALRNEIDVTDAWLCF